ncbi:MAG: hypothetical protein AAF217_05420 [Pseudomonadota bacterium]
MNKTSTACRIEVLVDLPLLRRIKEISTEVGNPGYTVLPTLEGAGHSGIWFDERVSGGAGSRVIFLTITSDEKADQFVTALEPLLESHGLIVTRSTVDVIRSERFQ